MAGPTGSLAGLSLGAMRISFARAFKRIGMQAPIKCAFKAFRETDTPWPDKMSGSSSF